jgi:pyruvate/2-oxoglutarate dehydrogenase complex dihydrolipoamide acyltransferase (E2) component
MSVMRKRIAEHMVASRRTSAHVHSVFEVNFERISELRESKKADYERVGTKLTFLGFIAKAVVDALGKFPVLNASLDGDNIVYKKDINLGIAVALENGLIVPVIRNADEKNLLGLSRAINDLASRARSKKLNPDEPIFCHPDGRAIGSFKKGFEQVLDEAGILYGSDGKKRVPYSLRHTYATMRISEGVSVFQLAANMGTSVEMIENFYGKKRMRDPKIATEVTKFRER